MSELETYLAERKKDVEFIAHPSSDEKTGRVQDNTAYALAHTHVAALLEMLAELQPVFDAHKTCETSSPWPTCRIAKARNACDRIAREAREKQSSTSTKK